MRRCFSTITILVGYKCNFSCSHCITASKTGSLSETDNGRILAAIAKFQPKELHFVGGETTLYVRDVNRILQEIPNLSKVQVRITTNGAFAKTQSEANHMLQSFKRLDSVELSYDRFHKVFLPKENIGHLYNACKKSGKNFGVLISIESPMDLVLLADLNPLGAFPKKVQYVVPFGAAKKNSLQWRHKFSSALLLKKKCPTRDNLIYLCQQGFSVCCSALTLSSKSRHFACETPEMFLSSEFYRLISTRTMGQIKEDLGVRGKIPEDRLVSVCAVCAYLFAKKYRLSIN